MEKDHQINNAGGASSNQVQQNSKLKAPNFDTKQYGADVDKLGDQSLNPKPSSTAVLLIDPIKQLPKHKPLTSKPVIWDCGSTLYDSFELNSFKRQLDMALTASNHKDTHHNLLFSEGDDLGPVPTRTHSMPHLSHGRRLPVTTTNNNFAPPRPSHPAGATNSTQKPHSSSSKLSRSFNKLLRSLSPKSSSKPITPTKPAETPLNLNGELDDDDDDDDRKDTRQAGAARWILVYEDDEIIYNKAIEVGGGLTTSLSTIPEAPEVVNNYVEEDTPKLCRRLSSSPLRRTMSHRFTSTTNCRSSDPFSFLSSCAYKQKQK